MLHEISPTSFGPKLAELWQSQIFAKSQKNFFKILKFQLLVFLYCQIRCSMKLVRLDLDLNWQRYGNPKFLPKFRKFLPPTENGCGPILWVVLGCNFVENFLSTIKKLKIVSSHRKSFFPKFRNSDLQILKSN